MDADSAGPGVIRHLVDTACSADVADVGLGILPGELLVHGWDLAKTMDRSWPVTRRQVSLI